MWYLPVDLWVYIYKDQVKGIGMVLNYTPPTKILHLVLEAVIKCISKVMEGMESIREGRNPYKYIETPKDSNRLSKMVHI